MLNITNIISKLKKIKAKKVFLQIPEELKLQTTELVSKLEKQGFIVLVSCDVCYGACDLKSHEAEKLGCDALVHVGHSDFGVKSKIPVIYEEYKIDFNPIPLLKKNLDKLKSYKKICLLTTIQYESALKTAKNFLKKNGKEIFIGKPEKAKYLGQVLGCDVSAAVQFENRVNCYLFLGTGNFHPLGIVLKVKKPVLFLDFETGNLVNLEAERKKLEIKKIMRIQKAVDCKRFGILVSTKTGQMRIQKAEQIKKKLEKLGKTALILVMDDISSEKILGIDVDCLVNTACPRLTEDSEKFGKVILNPEDIDKL